jgi:hypothetical protein
MTIVRMRRRAALPSLTLVAASACGGMRDATTPIAAPPLLAVAAADNGLTPPASAAQVVTRPPGIVGYLRTEDQAKIAISWPGIPTDSPAELVRMSGLDLPESVVAPHRPDVMVVHHVGDHVNHVVLVPIATRADVLNNYPHPTEVAPGVFELLATTDHQPSEDPQPKPSTSAVPAAQQEPHAKVCWLGVVARSGDALVCGPRESVSVVYTYLTQVIAPQTANSDIQLEAYAKPVLLAEGKSFFEGLSEAGHPDERAPVVAWRSSLLGELIKLGGDAHGMRADVHMGATGADVDLTASFTSTNSTLARLLCAQSVALQATPAAVLKNLPGDVSEVFHRRAGSTTAWGPSIRLIHEGFKAFGDGDWKPGDIELLAALAKRAELATHYNAVYASGFDVQAVAQYTKTLKASQANKLDKKALFARTQYHAVYTGLPFNEYSALAADFTKFVTGHQTADVLNSPWTVMALGLFGESPQDTMPTVQFGVKRMNLTDLPAGAVAYELKSPGLVAPTGVSKSISGASVTYVTFPFEGGTAVVRAENDALALSRARDWYKGERSLATLPHGVALSAATGAVVAVASPRTLFSLFVGNEIPHQKSANTTSLFAAIESPAAFTPIVLQAESTTSGAAGAEVHVKLNVPKSAFTELLRWKALDK